MVKLIGISGRFGSGKDAIADVLAKHFGFIKLPMAMSLRIECGDALEHGYCPPGAPDDVRRILTSGEWLPGEVYAKPTPPEMRRLLQWWGTEYRRNSGPGYLVRKMREMIASTQAPVVIPDIRFQDEADMVAELGGRLWKVEREIDEYGDAMLDSHLSEKWCESFDGFDLRIANNGTLADLERKILEIMRCRSELDRIDAEIATGRHTSQSELLGLTLGACDWNAEMNRISGD